MRAHHYFMALLLILAGYFIGAKWPMLAKSTGVV
jgi:hypothetical protein